MFFIGAHINRKKTLLDTMETIKSNGGNALQIFVSNPRSASLVNIEYYDNNAHIIREYCNDNNFKLVIHSPYIINLAKEAKNGKKIIDLKDCYWVKLLLHELYISQLIGAVGVVVHVGKHTTLSYEEGLKNMFSVIKYIISEMRVNNYHTKLIIETPAGQGTELLTDLCNFKDFYNNFSKDDKKYLGICLDTAHVWSAGYELEHSLKILSEKNKKDIVIIHYNNSKDIKGARVDRHESIFDGVIPKKSMDTFLYSIRELSIYPLIILETPSTDYKNEIDYIKNCLHNQ